MRVTRNAESQRRSIRRTIHSNTIIKSSTRARMRWTRLSLGMGASGMGEESCCLSISFKVWFLFSWHFSPHRSCCYSGYDLKVTPAALAQHRVQATQGIIVFLRTKLGAFIRPPVQILKIFINKVSGMSSCDSSSIKIILSSFSTIPALARKRIAISEKAFVSSSRQTG